MNQIIQFNNHEIRTLAIKGEIWWVAADVCRILGIKHVPHAMTRIHEDDVVSNDIIDALGRPQKTNLVSESGLYDLILQSRKPEAATFRRWVTKEVLPSIRKNGFYSSEKTLADYFIHTLETLINTGLSPAAALKTANNLFKITNDMEEVGALVELAEKQFAGLYHRSEFAIPARLLSKKLEEFRFERQQRALMING